METGMSHQALQDMRGKISEYEYTIEKLQEMGQVGIWRYDFQENKIVWSGEILQIFESLAGEFNYGSFLNAVHLDDQEYVAKYWSTELPAENFDINHRLLVNDKLKWIRHKVVLECDSGGDVASVCGFVQDITNLKYLEEKAVRSAQLAAVGEFTTMIAHEVNNPLSGIINYAEIFKGKACDACDDLELMDRIIYEGERISGVVKNLLAFSYNSKGEKCARNISHIIRHVLDLMAPKFNRNQIVAELMLDDNLPDVYCNAQQIEQVILNILRNANQALSRGLLQGEAEKRVHIRAAEKTVDHNSYVELRIANNGPNIPENIIERIREPFYTTKPAGIGTGLGLSISSDILNDHNGFFAINSDPGKYTEMIVGIPVYLD
ncbi:MAG: hypothetical protein C0623_01485 [Desulfuromonas sp.]|nr:MAG: hypothetical protein C0623_01485 [Desulfuromonas sp.]